MPSSHYLASRKINLQILALLALAAIAFYPTTSTLFLQWTKWDQALGHSLLVFVLVAYLILQIEFYPTSKPPKIVLTISILSSLCFSALWFISELSRIDLLATVFLIATICALIVAATSFETFYRLLPVLGLAAFTLPVWSQLTDGLVTLASSVVGQMVFWIGMPAFIEGNRIDIAFGTIIIADGCSGLKYLIVTLLLGYFVCIENKSSLIRFTATLALCGVTAIVANWVRILTLIIIGNETQMQSTLMEDHELFGWAVYFVFLIPLFYFLPRLQNLPITRVASPKMTWLAAIPALIVFPALFIATGANSTSAPPYTLDRIGSHFITARGSQPSIISGHDTLTSDAQTYIINGEKIHTTLMATNADSKGKLVPYLHSIYNPDAWRATHSEEIVIEGEKYQRMQLMNYQNNKKVVLIYQYDVGSQKTANYYTAKLLQLKATLQKKRYFSLFAGFALCADDCSNESHALDSVARAWTASADS